MSTTVKAGSNIAPVPAGMHQFVCYAIYDIGTQPASNSKFRPSRKVILTFELPHETIELEREGKRVTLPRAISATFGASLGKKANLRRELESWRGRPFTEEELKGFDLKNVLKANGQVNVVHTNKAGNVYANVATISPLAKGMAKVEPVNHTLVFDLDEFIAGGCKSWPSTMPEWVQARVMQSNEYLQAMQKSDQPQPAEDTTETKPEDDDIPF